jgi:hypothetical protein
MRQIPNSAVYIVLILHCSFAYGQMDSYQYKRELSGISEQWHNIVLPDEVFGKINQQLSDIRIFGITASKDTLEVPYLLNINGHKSVSNNLAFSIINTSHTQRGHYVTFQADEIQLINQIKLDIGQKNFDWQVSLEGSQDLNQWFTILENYRIMSIHNESSDFQFTTLIFPDSKYRFYRLNVNSRKKPDLKKASLARIEYSEGLLKKLPVQRIAQTDSRQSRQSEIEVDLAMPARLSQLTVKAADGYDYYRPVTITFLNDSTKTDKGWIYHYKTLTSGILSSRDDNTFKFASTTLQKLKIIIENQNNQPLSIHEVEANGYQHELLARFSQSGTFFLMYGNVSAQKPQYDIAYFNNQIPENPPLLKLGEEVPVFDIETSATEHFFNKKLWLWLVLIIIVVLMGWFTVRMMLRS